MNCIRWIAKQAAEQIRKQTTVRSQNVPVHTVDGRAAASAAMTRGPSPASHHPATRYGRKVLKRRDDGNQA